MFVLPASVHTLTHIHTHRGRGRYTPPTHTHTPPTHTHTLTHTRTHIHTQAIDQYNKTRWVITFFIGLFTAMVAFGVDLAQEFLMGLKLDIIGECVCACV